MISSLIQALRYRMPYDLATIAVIGPGAGEAAGSLHAFGYKQVWQREEADAVLSLYQPGRLFDAIVLAKCLERLMDLPGACTEQSRRVFDQIDASLADGGSLCVWVTASALTANGLIELLAAHGFSAQRVEGPDRAEEGSSVIGIFSRENSGPTTEARRTRRINPG